MGGLDLAAAERWARMALNCVKREYPNKMAHLLRSEADAGTPKELTPMFYGCYDWHSAVHNHWVLVRVLRLFPQALFALEARRVLAAHLTAANAEREVKYMTTKGRESFERPYGLAWLLQLAAEMRKWQDPQAAEWAAVLEPLVKVAGERLSMWFRKLGRPVRTGEHSNTAFALALTLDYARMAGDAEFAMLLRECAARFYLADRNCPLSYEPSGEDFLSPCLTEADLMRRVLSEEEFAVWLTAFLPDIKMESLEVGDAKDGKMGHLIGLDLSRAWMLAGIAAGLPQLDSRCGVLRQMSTEFASKGIGSIDEGQYHGAHWLGSFVVYLLSKRGLGGAGASE